MDELRHVIGGTNRKYIEEMKGRWADFCAKVQFYGVWKKVLKPPFPLDLHGGKLLFHITNPLLWQPCSNHSIKRPFFCSILDFTIALLSALPSLFTSPTPPPKWLGNASEALLHILKVKIVMLGLYHSL